MLGLSPAKHVLSPSATLRIDSVEGTQRREGKMFCHFDLREKSFLDPSHLLGMTVLACHLASWRVGASKFLLR
jgi:hypothetical protein